MLVSLQWPAFFSDLLQCISTGLKVPVELYLRILVAIDEEVVDRQIVHTREVRATLRLVLVATYFSNFRN